MIMIFVFAFRLCADWMTLKKKINEIKYENEKRSMTILYPSISDARSMRHAHIVSACPVRMKWDFDGTIFLGPVKTETGQDETALRFREGAAVP